MYFREVCCSAIGRHESQESEILARKVGFLTGIQQKVGNAVA
jgi:hypothetical protein